MLCCCLFVSETFRELGLPSHHTRLAILKFKNAGRKHGDGSLKKSLPGGLVGEGKGDLSAELDRDVSDVIASIYGMWLRRTKIGHRLRRPSFRLVESPS